MNEMQLPLDVEPAPADLPIENEDLARRARELCAQLLIRRYLPKRSCRDLLLDDSLRDSVMRRLDSVGLQLVDTYTSDHFSVRLAPEIEADVRFDWATNTRLPRGALALLVILWAKLVLPRRVASEEARKERAAREAEALDAVEPTDGHDDTPKAEEEATSKDGKEQAPAPLPRPTVARAALFAEFGHRFGKTAFTRYIGQLKNAGFVVEGRDGTLREGPLLDPMVDGVQMASKLRDSVLWDLLEGQGLDDVASDSEEMA